MPSFRDRLKCPVCGSEAETGRPAAGADALQVDCPKCGTFVISGTALAMLESRLSAEPRAVARTSHAIRSRTTQEKWFEVQSTNLDSLVNQSLPAPEQQLALLLKHLRAEAGDAYLTQVNIGVLEALTSIVGAADTEALKALIGWAAQEGYLRVISESSIVLNPKAWNVPTKSEFSEPRSESPQEVVPMETVKGHCPQCGPNVNATVLASHMERWEDDEAMVWATDTYRILKCPACEAIYVQRSYSFSEDVEIRDRPDGSAEQVEVPQVTYWPAPARRTKPDWVEGLMDEALRDTLDEVYGALDSDQRILAAIGSRTALDRAMVLLGATADSFPGKLEELAMIGVVGTGEKAGLMVLTDAGSASAHRAWKPAPKNLDVIMAGMEAFVHRTIVLAKDLGEMKGDVPARSPRVRKPSL